MQCLSLFLIKFYISGFEPGVFGPAPVQAATITYSGVSSGSDLLQIHIDDPFPHSADWFVLFMSVTHGALRFCASCSLTSLYIVYKGAGKDWTGALGSIQFAQGCNCVQSALRGVIKVPHKWYAVE